MALLIAGRTASGKPTPILVWRLISSCNCCTWKGMSDEDAALAANETYYRAFVNGDMRAMGRIWAEDDVTCIHPGWPALVERQEILESYRQIFNNQNRDRIEARNETAIVNGDEARVLCVEFIGGAALAATNLFRRVAGTWRMAHHQASPIAGLVAESAAPPPANRLN
jgi:ketosteroid isomerase-like protein